MPKLFHASILKGEVLENYYPENSNFGHFIFQAFIFNSSGAPNDYDLIGYAMHKNGDVLAQIELIRRGDPDDPNEPHSINNVLKIAEFRITKEQLDVICVEAGSIIRTIKRIVLIPKRYVANDFYIRYNVKIRVLEKTAHGFVERVIMKRINPCPPAQPSTNVWTPVPIGLAQTEEEMEKEEDDYEEQDTAQFS